MLAGGRSSRMQRDKALLQLGGQTLLERGVLRLQGMGFATAISGRAGLSAEADAGAERIADGIPDAGPLAGVAAVLAHFGAEAERLGDAEALVMFVPVDVPLLPNVFVEWLWERALRSGAWATMPWSLGRPQPLCAVLDTRLGPLLTRMLELGERRVVRALEQAAPTGSFDQFAVERVASAGGVRVGPALHQWFMNANTPQEWHALQQVAANENTQRNSGGVALPRI